MKSINKVIVIALSLLFFQFWGCQNNHEMHETEHPAIVEDIEGTDLSSVVLTERAIERIGLQTTEVIEVHHSPARLVVPYSSIIYDYKGQAWVYTNPEPRTFVRQKVVIDFIEGDNVFLHDGPPVGTVVATVGVTELYGTETKVGH